MCLKPSLGKIQNCAKVHVILYIGQNVAKRLTFEIYVIIKNTTITAHKQCKYTFVCGKKALIYNRERKFVSQEGCACVLWDFNRTGQIA